MKHINLLSLATLIFLSALSFNTQSSELRSCMEDDCIKLFKEYKVQAKRRHSAAYSALGEFYLAGYGTEKNIKKALKSFKKAAKGGSSQANFKIASIYLSYPEVYDAEKAVKYFKNAARKGHSFSSTMAAMMYVDDYFEKNDYEEADKWLSIALDKYDPSAVYYAEQLEYDKTLPSLPKSETVFNRILSEIEANKKANNKIAEESTQIKVESEKSNSMEVIEVQAPEIEDILKAQVLSLKNRKGDIASFDSLGGRLGKNCSEMISCWGIDEKDFERYYNQFINGKEASAILRGTN